jgi:serine/threonine protein kinase
MGTVFEAVHTKLKRSVALKLLPASRWANPAAVARFEREMEVIGQLDHPNIVRASDAGEENGMHYLVMEHVDGLDLSRIVSRVGPLAVADACEIAQQAAIGLQYAHENHLVHRDIKPSNLMLAASGQRSAISGQQERGQKDHRAATVKILDLGLALLGDSHAGQEDELTTVGQLMGTLDYMSPEQGMDSHDVDVRADIYSLGATLYKLLTGSAPFATPQYDTLLKKVTALANKPVAPIQQLRSDIPDDVAAVIDRMLSKTPADRFKTPQEVAAALEPFAGDADLGRLLADALEAKEPDNNLVPPVISAMHGPAKPAVLPKQPVLVHEMRGWKFGGLLMILIFLTLAGGFVIFIATDRGELVVRAEENVQIAITKDGNTVKQLAASQGENAVTVWSGSYQVQIKGKSDELVLSQNSVSIRRGGRVVVHVKQRPKAASNTRFRTASRSEGDGGR